MRHQNSPEESRDRLNLQAGLTFAASIGYKDSTAQIVTEYALLRHSKGEEAGAEKTWLHEYPHDLTSWKMILAHAMAIANQETATEGAQ